MVKTSLRVSAVVGGADCHNAPRCAVMSATAFSSGDIQLRQIVSRM
jgi:hypothetical protein